MFDDPQQIQARITELREMKSRYLKEISKYKTVSGMKLEETARYLEEKNALAKEAKDREAKQIQLEEDLKIAMDEARRKKQEVKSSTVNDATDTSDEREKLKEKFSSLLETHFHHPIHKYIRDYYTEAYTSQNNDAEEDNEKAYSKSAVVHTIAVCLEEDAPKKRIDDDDEEETEKTIQKVKKNNEEMPQYVTTFRVTPHTKNSELIKAACDFWDKSPEDYEAFDEKGAKFETKEVMGSKEANTLERFWRSRRNENNQLMIFLKRKRKDVPEQNKEKEQKDRKLDIPNQEDEGGQNGAYQSYNTLLPKLKRYININRTQDAERQKNFKKINDPASIGENHFCVVFIIAVLMLCNLISVVMHRTIVQEYYSISNVNKAADLLSIANINSMETFLDEVLDNIAGFFPQTFDEQPALGGDTSTVKLYKPILIRMYRVNKIPCEFSLANIECYYAQYNRDNRNTSDFNDTNTTHEFSYYKGEIPINGTITGIFGEYDLDAYQTSYDPRLLTTSDFGKKICLLFANSASEKTKCVTFFENQYVNEDQNEYDAQLEAFKTLLSETNSRYVDASTRALRISMSLFQVNSNNFLDIDLMIEITPTGTVMGYLGTPTVYRPNLKENTKVPQNVLNVIIVIFNTFLLLFVIYNLFTSGNGGINLGYFVTLQGLLNTLIIIFCYLVHAKIDNLNGYGVTKDVLINDQTLTSVNQLVNLYDSIFIFRSLVIAFLLIRIALVSKLNTRIEILVTALQNSIPHLLLMTICSLLPILSLSFLCNIMIGPYNVMYLTFRSSLSAVLVLLTGNEANTLFKYTFTECFMIVVGFFFLYFLILSAFPAVSVENYRLTMLDYSEEYHTKFTWKPQDYFSWLFSWVPNRFKCNKDKLNAKLNKGLKVLELKPNFDTKKVTGFLSKGKELFSKKKNEGRKKKKVEQNTEE